MSTVPLFGAAEWAQKQMHEQCWTGIIKPRAAITQPPSGHFALSPKIQLKENANWDHPREDWTSKHIKTTHPGCQRQQVGYETIPQKRWLLRSHIQHSPIYVVQHSPILQTQHTKGSCPSVRMNPKRTCSAPMPSKCPKELDSMSHMTGPAIFAKCCQQGWSQVEPRCQNSAGEGLRSVSRTQLYQRVAKCLEATIFVGKQNSQLGIAGHSSPMLKDSHVDGELPLLNDHLRRDLVVT